MTLDYLKDVLLDLPKETDAISESILNQIDTMKKAISSRAFCGEPGTNDLAEESAERLLKAVLQWQQRRDMERQV